MINIILSIYYILDKISIYLATLMIKGKRLEGLYILHLTNHRLGIFKTCLYILHPTNHRLGIFKTCLYILHPTNHRLGIFKSCLYILHPTNHRLGIFRTCLDILHPTKDITKHVQLSYILPIIDQGYSNHVYTSYINQSNLFF